MATENSTQQTANLDRNAVFERLDHAQGILHVLTHAFGGDSGLENPAKTDGLGVVVQCVARILYEANDEIMEADDELPDDLRWRTMEAARLLFLMQEIVEADSLEIRLSDGIMCSYLGAASDCVQRAMNAMTDQVKPKVLHTV